MVVAAGQDAPASQPATREIVETWGAARQRLARIKPQDRGRRDIVLLTALDFALAIGSADGSRAAGLLDAPGYQALPLDDNLPERPDKPIQSAAFEKLIAARTKADVADLPMDRVEVLSREAVRAVFPALATWMLPPDWAVVFHPPARAAVAHWITGDAGVVIRLRADKPSVVGGNLLEALGTIPVPTTHQ